MSERTLLVVASTKRLDSFRTSIPPGAWRLARFRGRREVRWNHDRSLVIGECVAAALTREGLLAELELDASRLADAALALARRGALGVSVGFAPREWTTTSAGVRLYQRVDLGEISLGDFVPSNLSARVLAGGEAAALARFLDMEVA